MCQYLSKLAYLQSTQRWHAVCLEVFTYSKHVLNHVLMSIFCVCPRCNNAGGCAKFNIEWLIKGLIVSSTHNDTIPFWILQNVKRVSDMSVH